MNDKDELSPSALRALGAKLLDQVKTMRKMMIIFFVNDVVFLIDLLYLVFHLSTAVK